MTTRLENLVRLAQAVDVLDLMHRLDAANSVETCQHDFRITQTAARRADWHTVEHLLNELGAFCDCEVALNIYGDLSDAEMDAMLDAGG